MAEPTAREPLNSVQLLETLAAVPGPGGHPWRLDVVEAVGSTNADLVLAARADAPEGSVLAAELQEAGRGRLGRTWTAPARSALTFSVLLRPANVPLTSWTWLPLLVGVAVADGIRRATGVQVGLKWPNDVLTDAPARPGKLGGILSERADTDAAVVGVGLNVSLTEDELPVPTASSLRLAGAPTVDRNDLLVAVLLELVARYDPWCERAGDAVGSGLRSDYLDRCATVNRTVQVQLPDGGRLTGRAADVDEGGRLVVEGPDGRRAVGAGDVVHVR